MSAGELLPPQRATPFGSGGLQQAFGAAIASGPSSFRGSSKGRLGLPPLPPGTASLRRERSAGAVGAARAGAAAEGAPAAGTHYTPRRYLKILQHVLRTLGKHQQLLAPEFGAALAALERLVAQAAHTHSSAAPGKLHYYLIEDAAVAQLQAAAAAVFGHIAAAACAPAGCAAPDFQDDVQDLAIRLVGTRCVLPASQLHLIEQFRSLTAHLDPHLDIPDGIAKAAEQVVRDVIREVHGPFFNGAILEAELAHLERTACGVDPCLQRPVAAAIKLLVSTLLQLDTEADTDDDEDFDSPCGSSDPFCVPSILPFMRVVEPGVAASDAPTPRSAAAAAAVSAGGAAAGGGGGGAGAGGGGNSSGRHSPAKLLAIHMDADGDAGCGSPSQRPKWEELQQRQAGQEQAWQQQGCQQQHLLLQQEQLLQQQGQRQGQPLQQGQGQLLQMPGHHHQQPPPLRLLRLPQQQQPPSSLQQQRHHQQPLPLQQQQPSVQQEQEQQRQKEPQELVQPVPWQPLQSPRQQQLWELPLQSPRQQQLVQPGPPQLAQGAVAGPATARSCADAPSPAHAAASGRSAASSCGCGDASPSFSASTCSSSVGAVSVQLLEDFIASSLADSRDARKACTFQAHMRLPPEGIERLAIFLAASRRVRGLSLAHNQIGPDGAKRLCKAMRAGRSVTTLDLPDNAVGDEGAAAIAGLLEAGCRLRSLQIAHNGITDAGMIAIAQAMQENHSLERLSVHGNAIGTAGCRALTAAVAASPSLKVVEFLPGNAAATRDIKALARAVMRNRKFRLLHLFGKSCVT